MESLETDSVSVLELSFAYTELELHAVALRPHNHSSFNDSFPEAFAYGDQFSHAQESVNQTNALSVTLEAGKRFLDTLLARPPNTYPHLCFNVWLKLPHIILSLARLCTPDNQYSKMNLWDVKTAQDRVRLDLYLESLCYRMQNLSPLGSWDGRRETMLDFWRAMNMILDLTRTWYVKKIREPSSHASSGPVTASSMGSHNGSTSGLPLTPDIINTSNNRVPAATSGRMEFQTNAVSGANDVVSTETECPLTNIQTECPLSGSSFNGGSLNVGPATGMDFGFEDTPWSDPFAAFKSGDFDMELFLDLGVWGSDSYHGMGFGGGYSGI